MDRKLIEQAAESPAKIVDKVVATAEELTDVNQLRKPIREFRDYWHRLGPGLTTGAADDDPSGIATYSQAGAGFGFNLLWLAGFTFPLMATVQEMCARIGLVTGRGLAANIRQHFPPWVLYLCTGLLFVVNTFNIGADLGAMAKATQLLNPNLNFSLILTLLTIVCLGLQIFTSYKTYARYLKWLALTLIAYVITPIFINNLDWSGALIGAITPKLTFSAQEIVLVCAILGTTISPYLFFWQTAQEVEEEILQGKTTVKLRQHDVSTLEINHMRQDIWSGMFVSNLVMFFIILVAGATLHLTGITTINTASEAAEALRPLAGDQAYLLFSLGIIGTGLLAVPVLAGSASYALSESLGWKDGLYRKLKEAYAFYGVIILATVVGYLINFSGLDPIKALLYSAIGNGLIAPIILALIVLISSNHRVMGSHVNQPLTKVFGWVIVGLMALSSLGALILL